MHVRKALVTLLCLFTLTACNRSNSNETTSTTAPANTAPRDMKQDIEKALAQAGFEHDVNVDIDHSKGVVTLKGRVRSQELKDKAGQVVQPLAAGHVVSNELSVEPVDEERKARTIESNVDDAIEKNYKAALIANHLDRQNIRFHAKNGVLTLDGSAKSAADRAAAEKVAASIPNVQQVVNKLDVKR